MSRKTMEDRMEKIEDIQPTAELSPEIIKTICQAISQEFYNWELKEEKSMGIAYLKFLLLGRKPHIWPKADNVLYYNR